MTWIYEVTAYGADVELLERPGPKEAAQVFARRHQLPVGATVTVDRRTGRKGFTMRYYRVGRRHIVEPLGAELEQ